MSGAGVDRVNFIKARRHAPMILRMKLSSSGASG